MRKVLEDAPLVQFANLLMQEERDVISSVFEMLLVLCLNLSVS